MLLFSTWLVGLGKYLRIMDRIETTVGDDCDEDFETWRNCDDGSSGDACLLDSRGDERQP